MGKKFGVFSPFFSLKKLKKTFPPGSGSKMFYIFLLLLILGSQLYFSEALRQVKKENFKDKFGNWDPITI